jgi:hypothetical protein
MKKIKTKKRKTVSHSDHGHKQGAGTKMVGETATTSRTIDDELLWYCSYGSNLSRSRFMTYISGGTPPHHIFSQLYFCLHTPSFANALARVQGERRGRRWSTRDAAT